MGIQPLNNDLRIIQAKKGTQLQAGSSVNK